jgi:hypothetical protein
MGMGEGVDEGKRQETRDKKKGKVSELNVSHSRFKVQRVQFRVQGSREFYQADDAGYRTGRGKGSSLL